jgi:hypothetical protein
MTTPKQKPSRQPKPSPPTNNGRSFTGETDRRGRPKYDAQGNRTPKPPPTQRMFEAWEDYVSTPRRKAGAARARRRNANRANLSGTSKPRTTKAANTRWENALAQHRASLGKAAPPRRRRRPSRRRAGTTLTLLAGTLAVTAAALHLVSLAMAAELGLASEGLGLAACWMVCDPPPPKAPNSRGKRSGQGGYTRGGTCGSTATKDKTPCGNPVAQGQNACYLHGGANPNGTGKSTPKAGTAAAPSAGPAPPAKRKRKAKPAPPSPAPAGSMPAKAP